MGCNPSKQDVRNTAQATPAPAAAATGTVRLNKPLSDASTFPSSFFEREKRFRREQEPRRVVPERREGPCRLRVGTWGGWKDGWCTLAGHELRFYAGAGGAPLPGAVPERSLELVGARLRAEQRVELALAPPGGGPAALLAFPDEQQRNEWMVGLGHVPGLFRHVRDYYEVGASWGRGATCEVRECVARFTGRRLALKTRVNAGSREASRAMHNELRVLQICAKHPHPAIPRLHDYFFDQDGAIELVIDLMEGGELFDHIAAAEQLSELEARDTFRQVVEGVAHLHSLGIAHRDLKPQNLMYVSADSSQVCITDYDLAKVNHAPAWEGHTPCGTLHYMAPEVVQQQTYSLAVDIWSLGVILYILLTGRMPFDGKDAESIAAAIEAGKYSMAPQLWAGVSQPAQDLVRALLQADPTNRPTALQVLLHPWLTAPLEEGGSLPLPSPAQLRTTFSQTERGRKLLALAAMAFSEGDLRPTRTAAASARSPAKALSAVGRSAGNSDASPLDFDMRPVRDQAESLRAKGHSIGALQGGAPPAVTAGSAAADGHEARLALLRVQLGLIETAARLQDNQAAEAAGWEPPGGPPQQGQPQTESPDNSCHAPAAETSPPPPRQQQQQRFDDPQQGAGSAAGLATSDSFADLDAVQVQEQDLLPGSAATSRRGSFSFNARGESLRLEPASSDSAPNASSSPCSRHDSSGAGATAAAAAAPFGSFLGVSSQSSAEPGRQAALALLRSPMNLPVGIPGPHQQQLPDEAELLRRLGEGQSEKLAPAAEQRGVAALVPTTSQGTGLGRPRPAQFANSLGRNGDAPPDSARGPLRSASSSRLQLKDVRLEDAEREPVDLAMHKKRQRLRRLATAPSSQAQP